MKKYFTSKVSFLLLGSLFGLLIGGGIAYLCGNFSSKTGPQLMAEDIYTQLEHASEDRDVITVLRPYFGQMVVISGNFLASAQALSSGGHVFSDSDLAYIEELKKVNHELEKIVTEFK